MLQIVAGAGQAEVLRDYLRDQHSIAAEVRTSGMQHGQQIVEIRLDANNLHSAEAAGLNTVPKRTGAVPKGAAFDVNQHSPAPRQAPPPKNQPATPELPKAAMPEGAGANARAANDIAHVDLAKLQAVGNASTSGPIRVTNGGKEYYLKAVTPDEAAMTLKASNADLGPNAITQIAKAREIPPAALSPDLSQRMSGTTGKKLLLIEAVPNQYGFGELGLGTLPNTQDAIRNGLGGKPITRQEQAQLVREWKALNAQGIQHNDLGSNVGFQRGADGRLRMHVYDFDPTSFLSEPNEDAKHLRSFFRDMHETGAAEKKGLVSTGKAKAKATATATASADAIPVSSPSQGAHSEGAPSPNLRARTQEQFMRAARLLSDNPSALTNESLTSEFNRIWEAGQQGERVYHNAAHFVDVAGPNVSTPEEAGRFMAGMYHDIFQGTDVRGGGSGFAPGVQERLNRYIRVAPDGGIYLNRDPALAHDPLFQDAMRVFDMRTATGQPINEALRTSGQGARLNAFGGQAEFLSTLYAIESGRAQGLSDRVMIDQAVVHIQGTVPFGPEDHFTKLENRLLQTEVYRNLPNAAAEARRTITSAVNMANADVANFAGTPEQFPAFMRNTLSLMQEGVGGRANLTPAEIMQTSQGMTGFFENAILPGSENGTRRIFHAVPGASPTDVVVIHGHSRTLADHEAAARTNIREMVKNQHAIQAVVGLAVADGQTGPMSLETTHRTATRLLETLGSDGVKKLAGIVNEIGLNPATNRPNGLPNQPGMANAENRNRFLERVRTEVFNGRETEFTAFRQNLTEAMHAPAGQSTTPRAQTPATPPAATATPETARPAAPARPTTAPVTNAAELHTAVQTAVDGAPPSPAQAAAPAAPEAARPAAPARPTGQTTTPGAQTPGTPPAQPAAPAAPEAHHVAPVPGRQNPQTPSTATAADHLAARPQETQGHAGAYAMLGQGGLDIVQGAINGDARRVAGGAEQVIIGGATRFGSQTVQGVANRAFIPLAVTKIGLEATEALVGDDPNRKQVAGETIIQGTAGLAGGIAGGTLGTAGAVALGASAGGFLAATVSTGGAVLLGAAVGAGVYYGNKKLDEALFGEDRFKKVDLKNKSHIKGLSGKDFVREIMQKPEDWNDVGKLNQLSHKLEMELEKQKKIMDDNDSLLPNAARPIQGTLLSGLTPGASMASDALDQMGAEALQKKLAARTETEILQSAKQEVSQFVKEVQMREKQKPLYEARGKLYVEVLNKLARVHGIRADSADEATLHILDQMAQKETEHIMGRLVNQYRPQDPAGIVQLTNRVLEEVETQRHSNTPDLKQDLASQLMYAYDRSVFTKLLADRAKGNKAGNLLVIKTEHSLSQVMDADQVIGQILQNEKEGRSSEALIGLVVSQGSPEMIERVARHYNAVDDLRSAAIAIHSQQPETIARFKASLSQAIRDGKLTPGFEETAALKITGQRKPVFQFRGTPQEMAAFSEALVTMGIQHQAHATGALVAQTIEVNAQALEKFLPDGLSHQRMLAASKPKGPLLLDIRVQPGMTMPVATGQQSPTEPTGTTAAAPRQAQRTKTEASRGMNEEEDPDAIDAAEVAAAEAASSRETNPLLTGTVRSDEAHATQATGPNGHQVAANGNGSVQPDAAAPAQQFAVATTTEPSGPTGPNRGSRRTTQV